MSVAILGRLDRLKPFHLKQGGKFKFSDVYVFTRKLPNMIKRLKGFGVIVICTGNIAHTMVEGTVRMAQANGIPVGRAHSSGVSAKKKVKQIS